MNDSIKYYYSPSKRGFYNNTVHRADQIPSDCIKLTGGEYEEYYNGIAEGRQVKKDKSLSEPPPGDYYGWDKVNEVWVYNAQAAYDNSVPTVITNRQAKLALLNKGYLDGVNEYIDDLRSKIKTDETLSAEDKKSYQALIINWDYGGDYERNDPVLLSIATLFKLDKSTVDELFIYASTL